MPLDVATIMRLIRKIHATRCRYHNAKGYNQGYLNSCKNNDYAGRARNKLVVAEGMNF